MSKHTVFVEFYYPSSIIDILSCTDDDKIKEQCFEVSKFDTPEEAVDAYEHTQAPWSVILDDDEDVHKFIDEAYDHLKSNNLNDRRWLYKHFV